MKNNRAASQRRGHNEAKSCSEQKHGPQGRKKLTTVRSSAERSTRASDLLNSEDLGRTVPAFPQPNTVVNRPKPEPVRQGTIAEVMVSGLAINALTAAQFSKGSFGDVDLTECLAKLNAVVSRVHGGDLREAEALLVAQAVSLNALYTHLANLGAKTEYIDKLDRYVRLGLKAQGQCRATLETLAEIKRPRTVFAQQANVAHGPQQVNNTVSREGRDTEPARAAKPKNRAKRTIRGS